MSNKNVNKIYLGAVGSGLPLLTKIKDYLEDEYELIDFSDNDKNYVEIGAEVGKAVSQDQDSFGIIICGNGFGISYGANIYDVRVSNCINLEQVISTREGNNANVLALGAKFVDEATALNMVETFISTKFAENIDQDTKEFLQDSFDQITKLRSI